MLKSTASKEEEEPSFPYLMKDVNRGLIILASEKADHNFAGTVVVAGTSDYKLGDFERTWSYTRFVFFHGTVSITDM